MENWKIDITINNEQIGFRSQQIHKYEKNPTMTHPHFLVTFLWERKYLCIYSHIITLKLPKRVYKIKVGTEGLDVNFYILNMSVNIVVFELRYEGSKGQKKYSFIN